LFRDERWAVHSIDIIYRQLQNYSVTEESILTWSENGWMLSNTNKQLWMVSAVVISVMHPFEIPKITMVKGNNE
jgi:hypothetical protein